MSLRKILSFVVLSAIAYLPTSAYATALIGTETFQNTDDLTVVEDGDFLYEFLDLPSSQGMSQTKALSEFGKYGFTIGTSDDLTKLFRSFGLTYGNKKNSWVNIGATSEQASHFMSYLGEMVGGGHASLGSFIDVEFGQSVSCIANDGCYPRSFVNNEDLSAGDRSWGIYLVRISATNENEIPEPTLPALLALGITALAAFRPRKMTQF